MRFPDTCILSCMLSRSFDLLLKKGSWRRHCSSMRCAALRLVFLLSAIARILSPAQAQLTTTSPARSLDILLQDYAYRAFTNPRTGVPYEAQVPSNLTGVEVSVVRLRSGSLRARGVRRFNKFSIPAGLVVQPRVERLGLVYQNLGNWSSVYYPLLGYSYLAPVIGLLAYNAANLSGTDLPELDVVASGSPMSINFTNVSPVPDGLIAKCVWFGLNGLPAFRDLVSAGMCSTYRQGHFSIVVNSTDLAPAPSPSGARPPVTSPLEGHKHKVWKIVAGVVGGFIVLVLLALLLVCIIRCAQTRKMKEMERQADAGEALRTARVGNTQAPAAFGTRTQPVLENEYAA